MPSARPFVRPSGPQRPAHSPGCISDQWATGPALDRATGLIEFGPHAESGRAASLGAFLISHGVRLSVVDEEPPFREIQLLGVLDLDRVMGWIAEWQGRPNPQAVSQVRPGGPGQTGRVHAIDSAAGAATIRSGGGRFTIVELLADRGLDIGDEMAWDEPNGLGAAVYQNRTKGTRLKVFVQAHQVRVTQLPIELRGW